MSVLRKPEGWIAGALVELAILLMLGRGEHEVEEEESVATVTKMRKSFGMRKSRGRQKSRSEGMPPLSRFPQGEVFSVNQEYGFAILRGDSESVRVGSRVLVRGADSPEIWMKVTLVEDAGIVADLYGRRAAELRVGETVYFPDQTIVMTDTATVDPRTIRWTDPDAPGSWAD